MGPPKHDQQPPLPPPYKTGKNHCFGAEEGWLVQQQDKVAAPFRISVAYNEENCSLYDEGEGLSCFSVAQPSGRTVLPILLGGQYRKTDLPIMFLAGREPHTWES